MTSTASSSSSSSNAVADVAGAAAAASLLPSAAAGLLSPYSVIGFDLDHTLARYRLDSFAPFLFSILRDYLVAQRGFPAALARVQFDANHTHKALLWDALLGHCVKLGADRTVQAASHGCLLDEHAGDHSPAPRMLTRAQIRAAYPHPLTDFDGSRHPRWHACYTFFETPCIPLLSALVELADRTQVRTGDERAPTSYAHIFPAISAAYEFHLGSPERGEYFPAFRRDPGRFLHPRPEVARWLRSLRASRDAQGRRRVIFLATNSKMDYTELLCSYSFGPGWRALFDVTIVDAKKPGFFMAAGATQAAEVLQPANKMDATGSVAQPISVQASASAGAGGAATQAPHVPRPFYFVDPATLGADLARPPATLDDMRSPPHGVFVHGNAPGLQTLFHELLPGPEPFKVIYFGDHLHTDCMATRQFTSWASGAVVEEIEHWHGARGAEQHRREEAEEAAASVGVRDPRERHQTFHSLEDILTAQADAVVHAASKAASAFGSFFHHHALPSSPQSHADGPSSLSATASDDASIGGVEWTYWHRVISVHCDVVVGCLTDCIPNNNTTLAPPAAKEPTAANAAGSALVSTTSSQAGARAAPRLKASCLHPPTLVRFQPAPFGSSHGVETPAQRQFASSSSSAASHPEPVTLEYSIHRVPASMKGEMRPIFPELSTWGQQSEAASVPQSSAAFMSLPLLCVPTFQRSHLCMTALTAEVEREKNRLLESFDCWARRVCTYLRSRVPGPGAWADLVDPCTGYPTLGPHGSSVYSEVDAAQILLSYAMEQVGNCAVITHPTWHLQHYPASMLTTASLEQLQEAIAHVNAELACTDNAPSSSSSAVVIAQTHASAPSSSSASSSSSAAAASIASAAPAAASVANPTGIQCIASFAHRLRFEDMPADVVHLACRVLADSLACALAATTQVEIAQMARLYGVPSSAAPASHRPLWGTSLCAPPAQAAMVNSAAIRCLDCNDLYLPLPPRSHLSSGHCSDALGGVLALMDPARHRGQQLLTAVVVAYEVQSALSHAIEWLARGIHSVSQICFAVPAAAAALRSGSGPVQGALTEKQTTNAIALAATTGVCMNSWLKLKPKAAAAVRRADSTLYLVPGATAPTALNPDREKEEDEGIPSIKFLSAGLAASRGVESVHLAQLGVTANPDALETLMEHFDASSYVSTESASAREVSANALGALGTQWAMHRHLVKLYSAQFNLQAIIHAALSLFKLGVRWGNIRTLRVHSHSYACAGVQGSPAAFKPGSQGSADHSTPFVVTMALRDGIFTPASAYAKQAWRDEEVLQCMRRIKLHVDESFERRRIEEGTLGCRIEPTLFDGTVQSAEQLTTLGHPDAPVSDEQLLEKWNALLEPLYGAAFAQQLWQACLDLKSSRNGTALEALESLLATQPRAESL